MGNRGSMSITVIAILGILFGLFGLGVQQIYRSRALWMGEQSKANRQFYAAEMSLWRTANQISGTPSQRICEQGEAGGVTRCLSPRP